MGPHGLIILVNMQARASSKDRDQFTAISHVGGKLVLFPKNVNHQCWQMETEGRASDKIAIMCSLMSHKRWGPDHGGFARSLQAVIRDFSHLPLAEFRKGTEYVCNRGCQGRIACK